MSRRVTDANRTGTTLNRIRQAHGRQSDELVAASEWVWNKRAHEDQPAENEPVRVRYVATAGEVAEVRAALDRSRVVPWAVQVPCLEHRAEVGQTCWRGPARGVCGDRTSAGLRRRFL